jgi:hypothetical protein
VLDYMVMVVNESALRDSLRQSTAAYNSFYRALWAQVAGAGTPLGRPIGEAAAPIEADIWFQRDDAATSRPVRGKVNLVVFLDQRECFTRTGTPMCQTLAARLQRLGRKFPALEITLVAQTRGWFAQGVLPDTPAREAALVEHAWLDERKLPGVLAVATTDFWRMPGLDRRRIDRDIPTATRYTFGRTWKVVGTDGEVANLATSFLVDQNGIVIDAYQEVNESRMPELISILLARPLASRP